MFWTRFSILVRDDGFLYLVIFILLHELGLFETWLLCANVDCLEGT